MNVRYPLLFLLFLPVVLFGQNTFQAAYGWTANDYAECVAQTSDGGYVAAGNASSFGGLPRAYIMKTDNAGNIDWSYTFGAGFGRSILVENGFIYLAGNTNAYGSGNSDMFLLKMSESGSVQWARTYGGSGNDYAFSMKRLTDGSFILCGYTFTYGDGNSDVYLVRADSSGNMTWNRTYGGANYDYGHAVTPTSDGGFAIAGHTQSYGAGLTDVYVIKTNSLGDTLWTRVLGGASGDFGHAILETKDGNLLVSGRTGSFGAGMEDAYMLKMSMLGIPIWGYAYGGTGDDAIYSVVETADSVYVGAGESQSFGGYFQAYGVVVDQSGTFVDALTYGDTTLILDNAKDIATTQDGGFIFAGKTKNWGFGNEDLYLVKLDDQGNSGCHQSQVTPSLAIVSGSLTTGAVVGSGGLSTSPTVIMSSVNTRDSIICMVCDPVGTAFNHDSTSVYTAYFSDLSDYADSWFWDFGDGNTSTQQHPSHTYSANGTYTVCLTATNPCGDVDSVCSWVTILCPSPSSDFSFSVNNYTATFTDNSTDATGYVWDFGDGNTSTQQNPSHTYSANGSYVVCLTASNACGTDVFCDTVVVNCIPPSTDFSYSVNNYTATFTDNSTGATSWFWDFGDGNTSTQQDPMHTYSANGTYVVCLTASNTCGPDVYCDTIIVNCASPSTDFSHSVNNYTATFTDNSTGATSWFWDFGDGNTSTQQAPTHTYATNGTYVVCLSTTNACGTDVFCDTIVVNCALPAAMFGYAVNNYDVSFIDNSIGATSWAWDFGDGNTSTQQNPTHTYGANGTYTVCLVTSNACGADTACLDITINCIMPVADFTFGTLFLDVNFSNTSTDADSYTWDFGDGNTDTTSSPIHSYTAPGVYWVCLTAVNACGADTLCDSVEVFVNGIQDPLLADGPVVYPLPAENEVSLRFDRSLGPVWKLQLYDLRGRIVLQREWQGFREAVRVDLEGLQSGLYLYRLEAGSGSWSGRLPIRKP